MLKHVSVSPWRGRSDSVSLSSSGGASSCGSGSPTPGHTPPPSRASSCASLAPLTALSSFSPADTAPQQVSTLWLLSQAFEPFAAPHCLNRGEIVYRLNSYVFVTCLNLYWRDKYEIILKYLSCLINEHSTDKRVTWTRACWVMHGHVCGRWLRTTRECAKSDDVTFNKENEENRMPSCGTKCVT